MEAEWTIHVLLGPVDQGETDPGPVTHRTGSLVRAPWCGVAGAHAKEEGARAQETRWQGSGRRLGRWASGFGRRTRAEETSKSLKETSRVQHHRAWVVDMFRPGLMYCSSCSSNHPNCEVLSEAWLQELTGGFGPFKRDPENRCKFHARVCSRKGRMQME